MTPANPSQPEADSWPRITLVTPVYNSDRFIEQTIRSVLNQRYPNLEYIIVDGGSTDGTLDIIRKYESRVSWWISESDRGMYDALNKGFARGTGEIMGWISATDQLHLGGLLVVGSIFKAFPRVEWITGIPTNFNEQGMAIHVGWQQRWSRFRFLAGANRYIQQESTFWRRGLWERAGSRMDDSRRNANDFELWVRFFCHAQLYPVAALIGGFRMHDDSLGLQDLEACHRVHDEVIEAELKSGRGNGLIRAFRRAERIMMKIPIARYLWWQIVQKGMYRLPGPDMAPVIRYVIGKGWTIGK
jgi:glycosyltransferase involved in cell wall biosynthesis